MASLLLNKLHSFQFERTIDWRVKFPFLKYLEPELGILNPDGIYLCQSVEYPTSEILVIEDGLGISGSYKSVKMVPEIRIELFSDNKLLIERALIKWSQASYDKDGAMALPINDIINQGVQHIVIERINPVDISSVVANLAIPLNIDLPIDVIRSYTYQGYLENAPRYGGTSSAEVRVLELVIKVTEVINPIG